MCRFDVTVFTDVIIFRWVIFYIFIYIFDYSINFEVIVQFYQDRIKFVEINR